jgi:hypothetical protein
MTGPEHYTRAQKLLREVRDGHQEGTDVAAIIAAAQVHSTLALAAATALNDNAADAGGMPMEDFHAWALVAGVWQPKPKGQTA